MEYRINGFEQIKAFYSIVFEQKYDIKPQHISLYIFLINQNNRNNWVEWFKCPFDLAMSGACIGSKKTYYSCLSELQDWGFIKYEKGVNDYKAPKIMIEVLKCTSTVPQSEPQPIPQLTPQPIQLPTHIYKLITDNIKTINNRQKEFFEYVKLFFQQEEEVFDTCLTFDDFWNMYAKKVGKEKAEKKYKSIKEIERAKIKETLPSYLATIKDKKFQKDPLTYLNGKHWDDEYESTYFFTSEPPRVMPNGQTNINGAIFTKNTVDLSNYGRPQKK